MSDTSYRVRGRARHGDVAGWVRQADILSADPQLADKLKKLFARTQQVAELIKNNQVALGMTNEEVQASLGKPTRKNTKINAGGKQERLEYAMYEKVPQVTTGRDAFGQLVQTVIYVKVEVGTLSLNFKAGVVDEIEETKGNPLGNGGVQVVPAPIFF
jgi:phosphatidylserine decarboxylase